MELEFKHLILIYAIFIFLLFFFKPHLFNLQIADKEVRRRKFLMLVALFIILAILSYYVKIYLEYYM